MRICILGDAQSVHLQRIVPGLVERGVDVHIISHKPVAIPGATVSKFEVPPFGIRYPHRYDRRRPQYLKRLMRRFDIVHVHFLSDWGFTPEIMADGCFVASPWGSDIVLPPGEDPPGTDLLASRMTMLGCADGITAWGPRFARMIADFARIDVERIDLLPLGVDLELFKPAEPRLLESNDRPFRVGFFKGFREVYGPTYLMRAIPTVVDVYPRTRFHMIGDGPQLDRCKELSGFYDINGHIKWIRRQPHANMPNYLAGWDLTVIPSVCESFGVAALEASAMRVPVIASDVGGLPDTVLHEKTGLLVPPQAPEQLADAIIALLGDSKRRRRMGDAGREFVQRHYNWQENLDKWVTTYEAALDRRSVLV